MKERKHIDRLYQEKFRDFEATPNDRLWKSISAKLQEPEQKRPVISPLWSRLAGVAAILAIILLIGDWIFPSATRSAVVNEEVEQGTRKNSFSIAENSLFLPQELNRAPLSATEKPGKLTPSRKTHPQQQIILKGSALEKQKISSNEQGLAFQEGKPDDRKEDLEPAQKRSLEAAIQQEEYNIAEESSRGSFELKTHAAPIYQGNFGKGSFLDPQFSEKGSEAEITYSYGIHIAYHISDKIKIRSGVNKVNMSYNTSGIAYQAVVGPVDIQGVSFSETTPPDSDALAKTSAPYSERSTVGSLYTGMLNQKMGFIEVPVELEYNLIKKRFELNIIGGASTLFLDENRVSLQSNKVSAFGKAKNLKEISFSTNIGLGLDYNLSERIKLNFEPMLKYQLNTFSSNSVDNQPYYFGIYSGFSYKF